jgi:eukaryotic-like serine/threonine-protein kinase
VSDPSILMAGQVIAGRYEIIEAIGEGGMQRVYSADDKTFERRVAIKVPKSPSAEKRFRRSAIVSARVNHPNVAKTLDYLPDTPIECLVEELVPGSDLRRIADRYHRMDPFLVAHILHHLSKGVAASHHVGVVHRDLKPSNVIVCENAWPRHIKVTDFGIAKMAQDELEEAIELGIEKSITTSATLVGALPYMSPEFINDGGSADKPSDIWSLGAISYELLTGNVPFGRGLAAVAKIVAAKEPKKPAVFGSTYQFGALLDQLWDIIKACLQSNLSDRPTADTLVSRCADLCYSAHDREVGRIRNFGDGPGSYGFIARAGRSDVFFHKSSYYGKTPKVGERVLFSAFESGSKPRAHPVVPLKG